MEEKQDIMEQPQSIAGSQSEHSQENLERVEPSQIDSGSILGKFKNTESLEKAYESLQKEFTKKCQLLAEYQKDIQQLKNNAQEKTAEFLENNPEARECIDKLQEMVSTDKQLQDSDSPLLSAWNKYKSENYTSHKALSNNEEFLTKYIYSNETIKQKILDDYFKQLNIGSVPPMIAKQIGSKSIITKNAKPSNFSEAGKIVKSMLEK